MGFVGSQTRIVRTLDNSYVAKVCKITSNIWPIHQAL